MGETGAIITIKVQALTDEANARLQEMFGSANVKINAFGAAAAGTVNPLTKLREGSLATHESFRVLESSAFLLGGTRFPQMTMGVMGVTEAMRGLRAGALLTGASLGTLSLYLAPVLLAIGGGALIWKEWNSAEAEAAKNAKELAEAWKALPGLLKQINDLQKAGFLSDAAAKEYSDYLTGKKKLYVDGKGQVTRDATGDMASGGYKEIIKNGEATFLHQELKPDDPRIAKWVMDQATAGGNVSQEQVDALKKQKELTEQLLVESLTGMAKEIEEAHKKGVADREEIIETAKISGAKLSAGSPELTEVNRTRDAQLRQSFANEAANIATINVKQTESVEKQADAWEKLMAYVKATGPEAEKLLKQFNEEDEATKKLLDDYKRELELRREIANAAAEAKLKAIDGNPDLSGHEKAQQSVPIYQFQAAEVAKEIASAQNTLAQPVKSEDDQVAHLEAQKELNQLLVQQVELQNQIRAAQGQDSIVASTMSDLAQIQSKLPTLAQGIAGVFASPFEGLQSGLDTAFTKLLERGQTLKQFFGNVALAIEKSFVQSFAKMVSDFITSSIVMLVRHVATENSMTAATTMGGVQRNAVRMMETVFHGVMVALRVAAHFAGELACTAVTVAQTIIRAGKYLITAAIGAMQAMANIPYVGPILAVVAAAGIIAAGMAMMKGFAEGGRPAVGQMAMVGERGPELFVPDTAGTIIPAAQTASLLRGSGGRAISGGASGGGSGGQTRVSNYIYHDRAKMARDIEQDDAHEKWVADVAARTVQKMS
jgi:hypothetical protein